MALSDEQVQDLIYGSPPGRRYTQDSPVMPDVWLKYVEQDRVDVLLTPQTGTSSGELARKVDRRTQNARVAHSETYVVAELSFDELVAKMLPLTLWWREQIVGPAHGAETNASGRFLPAWFAGTPKTELAPQVQWLIDLVGRIKLRLRKQEPKQKAIETAARGVLEQSLGPEGKPERGKVLLWQVSLNREAMTALWASRPAVKADAAINLFEIDCRSIVWAVIDCGVDATHPGLCERENGSLPADDAEALARSRVIRTYDFTKLRTHVAPDSPPEQTLSQADLQRVQSLRSGLENGRSIDWSELEPLLRVQHDDTYKRPTLAHGTHVAGILSADWQTTDDGMPEGGNLVGIAPGLRVYDLRVISETARDEFSVIAALQFVRWLNGYKDKPVIHGVNLSLSIPHDFTNYACGKTPVCQECERLAATGVVVVAAAGNQGYAEYQTLQGARDKGFRSVSITDPGNAEAVITVGGTHRSRPFSYGVSYFSSRGPTGDGRYKPDLVAPAEKITSLAPFGTTRSLDGTSMAAPHVSGAAALMLARTEELVGDPVRVKSILCGSATDLGRERYFQGAGMLDVLRALQSV